MKYHLDVNLILRDPETGEIKYQLLTKMTSGTLRQNYIRQRTREKVEELIEYMGENEGFNKEENQCQDI